MPVGQCHGMLNPFVYSSSKVSKMFGSTHVSWSGGGMTIVEASLFGSIGAAVSALSSSPEVGWTFFVGASSGTTFSGSVNGYSWHGFPSGSRSSVLSAPV